MEHVETMAGLSLLLGDFDRDLFFGRHWEKRSIHIPHGDPGRFSHLISMESFFGSEIHRCAHVKASTRDAEGWNQEIRIQPEQARKLFRSGMTICATLLDESGPCREVIEAFREGITSAAPPHVNCYCSPHGRGYGLHFDTHPVWILQVEGSKHWTISLEPGVRNPPFNVVYPPGRDRVKLPWITLDRPDVDDTEHFMQVRLDPGDVLYLPAGCWHAARAEGVSLALTLALGRLSTMDLFTLQLSQMVSREPLEVTTRLSPFPRGMPASDRRDEVMVRIAADLQHLKDLVQRMDADALMRVYQSLADEPATILAGRQLAYASEQVGLMKRQSAREGLVPEGAAGRK
jgi:lysine-specific demethylase/histidyl-hydroxylase NO66